MPLFRFKSLFIIALHASLSWANPYQILGISPDSSEEEIKKAYLRKAKEEHPDVSSYPKAQAEKRFKEIQEAWEALRSKRSRPREVNREKQLAKEEATRILQKAWSDGTFSSATLETLPRLKQLRNSSPLSPFPNRSSKEDGEWEAIVDFFNEHQTDIAKKDPPSLLAILRVLDSYTLLTPESVRSIRSGFTQQMEQSLFEKAKSQSIFLDALKDRLERLNRSGTFVQSTNPTDARERAFGKTAELFSEKFGKETEGSKELQLAEALLNHSFEQINANQSRLHELGFLIRSIPPLLSPEEQLTFLSGFLNRVQSSSKDLRTRIESAITKLFSKNPELAKDYAQKTSLWKRLTRSVPSCDLILGKLARTAGY